MIPVYDESGFITFFLAKKDEITPDVGDACQPGQHKGQEVRKDEITPNAGGEEE